VTIAIRQVAQDGLPAFFSYLDDHLKDNGANGTPPFQPLSRAASRLPERTRASFTAGAAIPPGQPGWRRAWIAVDPDGAIAGHIDLRARPEPAAAHRALLGMGVHRDHRRKGLGMWLIETARLWAIDSGLDWIDLEVLSANRPARELYLRAGFDIVGEYADMYRIDGAALACTSMTLPLRRRSV